VSNTGEIEIGQLERLIIMGHREKGLTKAVDEVLPNAKYTKIQLVYSFQYTFTLLAYRYSYLASMHPVSVQELELGPSLSRVRSQRIFLE
jgi:hypothetical protein